MIDVINVESIVMCRNCNTELINRDGLQIIVCWHCNYFNSTLPLRIKSG
jgi:hypothetical protein